MQMIVQLQAPAALPPWKEPSVPRDTILGGPQNQYERGDKDKNPCSCRESNPYRDDVRYLVVL
jgi:hypothetical protein